LKRILSGPAAPLATFASVPIRRLGLCDIPLEFRERLHMLAEGKVDPRPLITGTVGLEGDAAFMALGDPEAHAKILIDPASVAASPS
jgi:hypothetical protein